MKPGVTRPSICPGTRYGLPPGATASLWALPSLAALVSLAACADSSDGSALAGGGDGGYCESPVAVAELPADLYEASGVARDPRSGDLYWVHNDSGNPAELYAVTGDGRVLAMAPVLEATERDIEDVAVGPCPAGSCLYLADIGDNLGIHSSIYLHRLPLPAIADAADAPVVLPPVRAEATWTLIYPDGPRDAESLAVDGVRGELIIVTKGRENAVELYTARLAELHEGTEVPDTLTRVGRLSVPIGGGSSQFVTAADLSPDTRRLAVRSYTTLYEFDWRGSAAFDTLATPRPSPLVGAFEAQGEGLAWDSAGEELVLVSEGRGGRPPSLSRIRCPSDPR